MVSIKKKNTSQASVVIVYLATMLICLVIFGFAAVTLLDIFVTQPALEAEAAESGTTTEDEEETVDYSSATETILFVGADGQEINAIVLLRVNPGDGTISIVPVSKYTLSTVDSSSGTMEQLFDIGGMSYLKTAVENAYGLTCDKYIKITNDGWAELVEYTGGMSSYVFPEDLYYKDETSGDLTSFSAGNSNRTLWGDDIRRIVTYPLYSNGEQTRVQVIGEIAVTLINDAFDTNAANMKTNIQNIFNTIYNNSDTDITSKTFASVRDAYEYMLEAASSPATYRMPHGEWNSSGYFELDEDAASEIQEYFGLTSVLEE
ncbi:MAG: LCP family protein [Oscillospiraceae bacterium]|nr:LCP family protein [Oscillospiraceae bacterium]